MTKTRQSKKANLLFQFYAVEFVTRTGKRPGQNSVYIAATESLHTADAADFQQMRLLST